jgi:hypothetical protein
VGVERQSDGTENLSGFLVCDAQGQLVQIVLNQAAPLASALVDPLRERLALAHIASNLDKNQYRHSLAS